MVGLVGLVKDGVHKTVAEVIVNQRLAAKATEPVPVTAHESSTETARISLSLVIEESMRTTWLSRHFSLFQHFSSISYVRRREPVSHLYLRVVSLEMFRDVIQTVMEVEMDEELGRERCQRAAEETPSPNYRNGYSPKTVKTQLGEIDIKVPRDRKGNYEPRIIKLARLNARN